MVVFDRTVRVIQLFLSNGDDENAFKSLGNGIPDAFEETPIEALQTCMLKACRILTSFS